MTQDQARTIVGLVACLLIVFIVGGFGIAYVVTNSSTNSEAARTSADGAKIAGEAAREAATDAKKASAEARQANRDQVCRSTFNARISEARLSADLTLAFATLAAQEATHADQIGRDQFSTDAWYVHDVLASRVLERRTEYQAAVDENRRLLDAAKDDHPEFDRMCQAGPGA